MEHHEAKRLMAVEKYLLDELPPQVRDEFEEHYFDCDECTTDLRATAAFLDAAKREFKNESASAPAVGPVLVAAKKTRFAVSIPIVWVLIAHPPRGISRHSRLAPRASPRWDVQSRRA